MNFSGRASVAGFTLSHDFPLANPLRGCDKPSGHEEFVTRLGPEGSALSFCAYVGGSADDRGWGVALDPAGNLHVTGSTRSSDFPTVNPFQPVHVDPGDFDALVARILDEGPAPPPAPDPSATGPSGGPLRDRTADRVVHLAARRPTPIRDVP